MTLCHAHVPTACLQSVIPVEILGLVTNFPFTLLWPPPVCFPPLSRYFVQGFVLSCPASFPGFRRSLRVVHGPVFLPSCGRACFVVRTCHILLTRSSVNGHWGRLSLRLLRVLLHLLCPDMFLFGSVSSSLGCIPGSGTAGT